MTARDYDAIAAGLAELRGLLEPKAYETAERVMVAYLVNRNPFLDAQALRKAIHQMSGA